jgi:hypothetical protein
MIYPYFIEPDMPFQVMWNAFMGLLLIWQALNLAYAAWKACLAKT